MRFNPADKLVGQLTPPADKSISHRAAIIAAMSSGTSTINNYLVAEDTESTLKAIAQLGATVNKSDSGVEVTGIGLKGLPTDEQIAIDVGNAGTLLRLLPGWLAGQPGGRFLLDGDESIRRRPVDRIALPLKQMGAKLNPRQGRFVPLEIKGSSLVGIDYRLPVASAQVKSCLLLAALSAEGQTRVVEPLISRDHTERMLSAAGIELEVEVQAAGGRATAVRGIDSLELGDIAVPGDLSSAAFAATAAVLLNGSQLELKAVGVNWTRSGFLQVLKRMGARVEGEVEEPCTDVPTVDPAADLTVYGSKLKATTVVAAEVPLLIDELPLVALLGVFAEGETVVEGAAELRVKESDRIESVVQSLRALGAEIEATADGFIVQGTGQLVGGTIDAHGDHRIAMLAAVAGLVSQRGVEVGGFEAAAVSYPSFSADLANLIGC